MGNTNKVLFNIKDDALATGSKIVKKSKAVPKLQAVKRAKAKKTTK